MTSRPQLAKHSLVGGDFNVTMTKLLVGVNLILRCFQGFLNLAAR